MDTSRLDKIAAMLDEWLAETETFADDFANHPYYEPDDLESGDPERFLDICQKSAYLGHELTTQTEKLQMLLTAIRKNTIALSALELDLESGDFICKS